MRAFILLHPKAMGMTPDFMAQKAVCECYVYFVVVEKSEV